MNGYLLIAILYQFLMTNSAHQSDKIADPKFSAPIANVTVPVGRDAILTCYVHDLVLFKVAWLRVDTQTILTIQNHVITKNHRIGISHTERRIWQLRIRDVRESDKGYYMCQINTDPMKSQMGYLDVVVPPDIIDQRTSQDLIVQEGENVTLTCAATGSPLPTVVWKREHAKPLMFNNSKEVISFAGSLLQIPFITKNHMGVYLCIASNGIPPTVSKRIMVVVNFKPKIVVMQRQIFASIGQKVTLECHTESNPNSVNYWMRSKPEIANQDFVLGGNYETTSEGSIYKVVMKLMLRPTKGIDFGIYKCVSKNSLGTTEEIIRVYPKSKILENNPYYHSNYLGSFVIKNDTMLQDYRFNENLLSLGQVLSTNVFNLLFCLSLLYGSV